MMVGIAILILFLLILGRMSREAKMFFLNSKRILREERNSENVASLHPIEVSS